MTVGELKEKMKSIGILVVTKLRKKEKIVQLIEEHLNRVQLIEALKQK